MRTLVIIALAYILFIHGLGGTSLWDPDEPRQAIMAREMVQRADYIHPYLNGSPYLEKPPLYSWLIIFASKLTGGIDEFASRLPSAIAATLLLLLTYFFGKRLDHEVSGFLSALILATNYQFLGNARESVMDMSFAFFIGLAVFLGYLCVEKGKKGLLPLALLPCALAIVTKGPVGIIVPVAVLFFYCIATKNLKAMFGPLVLGFLLALAVASLWFGLAGKAYMKEFILHQNINRFTTGFDHVEPFTYYFQKLFTNFLPWSIALPFAAFFAFRRRLWLPLIWLLVTFVFFDISKSKRAIYLLCCYPACALLVGIYLKERWYVLVEKGWTTVILSILTLGLLALPALLFPAMHRVPMIQEMLGKDPLFPAALCGHLRRLGPRLPPLNSTEEPGQGFPGPLHLPRLPRLPLPFPVSAFHGQRAEVRHAHHRRDARAPKRGSPVYMYGFNSPALIYYVGKPVTILQSPAELPAEKDDIIVVVEDKGGNTEPFKGLFPSAKSVRYERADYVVFTGAHAR